MVFMYHSIFNHSPIFEHLGGFENISITNSAEMNKFVSVYFLIIGVDS